MPLARYIPFRHRPLSVVDIHFGYTHKVRKPPTAEKLFPINGVAPLYTHSSNV